MLIEYYADLENVIGSTKISLKVSKLYKGIDILSCKSNNNNSVVGNIFYIMVDVRNFNNCYFEHDLQGNSS